MSIKQMLGALCEVLKNKPDYEYYREEFETSMRASGTPQSELKRSSDGRYEFEHIDQAWQKHSYERYQQDSAL